MPLTILGVQRCDSCSLASSSRHLCCKAKNPAGGMRKKGYSSFCYSDPNLVDVGGRVQKCSSRRDNEVTHSGNKRTENNGWITNEIEGSNDFVHLLQCFVNIKVFDAGQNFSWTFEHVVDCLSLETYWGIRNRREDSRDDTRKVVALSRKTMLDRG